MNPNAPWERFAKLGFAALAAAVFLFGGAAVVEPNLLLAMAVSAAVFLVARSIFEILQEKSLSFTPIPVHFVRSQIKHLNDPLLL